jgi:FlaA1/EpsC-like NDP-sugar epimerase
VNIPVIRHRLTNVAADALLIALAWRVTFWLRFNEVPPYYRHLLSWHTFALVVAIKLVVFALFGFYNRWWRYVSTRDMWGAARGVLVASLLVDLALYAFPPAHTAKLPRGVALIDILVLLAFVAGSRLLARTVIERPAPGRLVARGREVLVVGAGDAGSLVLRELQRNPQLGMTPIGLVDDDPRKKNLRVHGVRVLGTTGQLKQILRETEPDELLIAIPSAAGEVRRRVVDEAQAEGVPVKTLPALHELLSGDVNLAGQLRPVQVEDVLGREPVDVDLHEIAGYLGEQTVLITGAGGSIGAEICRQVSRLGPRRIVLVDQAETALFEIERELVDRGFTAALPVLADVGNRTKLKQVFEKYEPTVVFHTAAYKHVYLMELNPVVSVRNNVLATRNVAELAAEFGAKRFVLISSDKAAAPDNVYGRGKAICEWIVQAYGARDDVTTRFCAVRFGNVLNSAGSVIPIFRRQIERGGPVTVTHPEMTRFFMTIPEAVSLVVQAGAIGGRGQIFVLDMGEPVSILELARHMIRLSGKEPERDLEIRYIGVRPGEKLHEQLWNEHETAEPTSHQKILVAAQAPIDPVWLEAEIAELERLVDENDTLELVAKLTGLTREPRRLAVEAPTAQRTVSS